VMGFYASNTMVRGTNNFGFYSNISTAATTYQFYMAGTANCYIGSTLNIRNVTTNQDVLMRIGTTTHPNTGTSSYVWYSDVTAPSTSTSLLYGFTSLLRTAAAAFTLTNLIHFEAQATSLGAGSTVTNSVGFRALNGIATASNNYGFYSNINTASNTYQLYMAGTAPNFLNGVLSVGGGVIPTAYTLLVTPHAQMSAASSYVIGINGTMPTTAATNAGAMNIALTLSNATAYGNVFGIYISGVTLGTATATVSYGVRVANAIAVGTTNYGFYSDINTASNTYQLYMAGTALSYFGGPVGFQATPTVTATAMRIAATAAQSNASIQWVQADGTLPATATGSNSVYYASVTTTNSVYTTTSVQAFYAVAVSKGASHTLQTTYGLRVDSGFAAGSVNNYGVYVNYAVSGTVNYQIYAAGTAPSYIGSQLAVGTAAVLFSGAAVLGVGMTHPSTATTIYGVATDIQAPSTATTTLTIYRAVARTAAAAFTLSNLFMFYAEDSILGAGSTVTNAYGFAVSNNFAGAATNTYGFYSNIAAAAATYQLYMDGTAASYIKGPLYVGGVVSTLDTYQLYIGGTHPATISTPQVLNITTTFPSTATSNTYGVQLALATAAAVFTMSTLRMFEATQVTLGAGSAITTVYGFMARNAIAVGGTNIGFYSDINSATNTYQLFMGGTAASYFGAGANYFGSTTAAVADATARIHLNGATSNFIAWNTAGTAQPAFTTRSAGTKIILFPNIGAAQADYAIGIESGRIWFTCGQAIDANGFRFYGGTTLLFSVSGAGYIEGYEVSDPAAPSANTGRLYFRDNGSGKTQLCVRFNTGAVQVVATEP
jgi:hypothetical protein